MKKKLLFLFALCIAFQGVSAQYRFEKRPIQTKVPTVQTRVGASMPEQYILAGLCSLKYQERDMAGLGNAQGGTFGGAVQISKDLLKGGKIYGFRVAILDVNKKFNVFISKELGGTPIYSQEATVTNLGWNYVVFDTPQEINEENFYIGYTIRTSGYPLVFENGPRNTKADWITQDGKKWDNLSTMGFAGAFAIQAIVADGDFSSLPQNDAMVGYIDSDINKLGTFYAKSGTTADFSVTVTNYGIKPLNSFDLVYKVGENTQTKSVTGLSLPNGYSTIVDITEVPFTGEENVNLVFTVNKPNNLTDDVISDNEVAIPVQCYINSFDRKILVEQYTGQTCPNCPQGEAVLKESIKGIESKVMWVAHHAGYQPDNFTISESKSYANFFDIAGAPSCTIDRTVNDYGLSFHPGYTTREMMDTFLGIPSFASIALEGEFNNENKELKVTVSGELLKDLPKANLNVFIIEDGFIANQSGGSSKYEHNHVIRDVISALYGDKIELDANKKFSKTYTFTVPEKIASFKCNPYNMSVVAFIGDYTSGKNQQCKVHNSEILTLASLGAESSIDNTSISNMAVYAEGSTVYIDGEFNEAAVYTTNGELVKVVNKNSFTLENGLYIIRLVNGEQSLVKKIIVNN